VLRFGRDHRMREVGRVLRSSRPVFLKVRKINPPLPPSLPHSSLPPSLPPALPLPQVDRPTEFSDHEYLQRQQAKLLLLCRRSLSTPTARGMLTLSSFHPLLAEPLPLPRLCLAASIPPSLATLHLDTSAYTPDLTLWPEFHNGVAAGLRLAPALGRGREGGRGGGGEAGREGGITRTWIIYNRPRTPSHAHGGLLLALGLQVGREGGEGGRGGG